jgi:hypothetical protein
VVWDADGLERIHRNRDFELFGGRAADLHTFSTGEPNYDRSPVWSDTR